MTPASVRALDAADAAFSARLHLEVLSMEFLSRFGPGFLTAYHRAWIRSPAALALAATAEDGAIEGVLLGSVNPRAHYDWMLRHAGAGLAARMVARAMIDPALGRDLVMTRAARYATAVPRRLLRHRNDAAPSEAVTVHAVGEVTHLMVSSRTRSAGHGRALLAEAERRATAAGLDSIELVTPPDLEARGFYDHMGWKVDGEIVSRSGERFVRFRRDLPQSGCQADGEEAVSETPT